MIRFFLPFYIPLALTSLLFMSTARADGWGMFSNELRDTQAHLRELTRQYEQLGPLQLRQTVPQAGAQLHMGATPPPQAPWIQLDLGRAESFERIVIVPAIVGLVSDAIESYAFPQRFRIDGSMTETFDSFQLLYDSASSGSGAGKLNPISPFPVVIDTPMVRARYLRVTVTELAQVANRWTYALSEVMVIRGDRNIALNAAVTMNGATSLAPVWSPRYLVDGRTPLGTPIEATQSSDELPEFDGVFFNSDQPDEEVWFQIDLGSIRSFDAIRLFPVHARQGADYPGYAFPKRFRIETSDSESFEESTTWYQTQRDFDSPGNNPVTLQMPESQFRFVRFVSERGSLLATNKVGFSEVQVLRESENLALNRPITAVHWRSDRPLSLLVDGEASYGKISSLQEWFDRWKAARNLQQEMESTEQHINRFSTIARRRASWTGVGVMNIGAITLLAIGWQQRRRRSRQRAEFRMRLAQDLHDEIGSNLAAISRIGEVGEAVGDSDELKEDFRSIRELAGECTESMHETLWLLGGPKRRGESLSSQLQSIARRMLPGMNLQWAFDPAFVEFCPGENAEREIVLIFKAMIANIARSANATRVDIAAIEYEQGWRISVEDNGDGFDAFAWESRMEPRGMGLHNMKNRIKKLGGSLQINSQPGQGARLTIEIGN
ncbi:signal transduction histidine kinase [Rhodopirellula rubra]|uniref:histidine kinase n=1 Tax=Aporhodopirellula rubra TaxID=980271 RepID=A0A7W5DYW4_9BACT|nr:ATP-binding protein [Aporhodopirellula rubra]MBB3206764.1 signal transduction histidine kinase [Aporhodopirellula rubra]